MPSLLTGRSVPRGSHLVAGERPSRLVAILAVVAVAAVPSLFTVLLYVVLAHLSR